MIHARRDVLDCIAGVWNNAGTPENSKAACGNTSDDLLVWAATSVTFGWRDTSNDFDCPKCAELVHAAVIASDPVRWDLAEERGFAPKLEAK